MEREQYQTEIRDLQDQLSEMHDELDSAKKSTSDGEKDIIITVMHSVHSSRENFLLALSLWVMWQMAAGGVVNHHERWKMFYFAS